MKRLIQFVALLAVVLLAGQPIFAYDSCSQQSCTENVCAPACCGGMSGMDHHAAMHSTMDCSPLMEALPAGPGCGQPSPSVAAIAREALAAGSITGYSGSPVSLPLFDLSPPAATRAGGEASHPVRQTGHPVDRGVLFHVFRI
jgi:hypothetical protein